MRSFMNIIYCTSNWTMAALMAGGALVGLYGCFNIFGVAATAFLTAMIAVILLGWVLL